MPTYEYACTGGCEGIITKQRSIKENDPGYKCNDCDMPLQQIYSKVGVIFNGSGYYSTDNRKK